MRATDIPGSSHASLLLATYVPAIAFSGLMTLLVVRYVPRLLTFIWSY